LSEQFNDSLIKKKPRDLGWRNTTLEMLTLCPAPTRAPTSAQLKDTESVFMHHAGLSEPLMCCGGARAESAHWEASFPQPSPVVHPHVFTPGRSTHTKKHH